MTRTAVAPEREGDLIGLELAELGVQSRYDEGGNEAFTVRDGDVAVIRSGYQPLVAAPGHSLYYLWIMAGEGRQLIPFFDPAHAWVQES